MSDRSRRPGLLRRFFDWVAQPYLEDVGRGHAGLQESIERLHGDLGRMHRELEEVSGRVREIDVNSRQAAAASRAVFDQEVENRRRVRALRETEEYELAFTEEEPLVSFLVPTYKSFETLRDVALPSILGQTHRNLEVIVVGDCSPPETERAIAEVGDPRVRYVNRTIRGPYHPDPARRWYSIGSTPYDDALAHVRGRWIAALGDDDAVRPDHTERLLAAARENRFEHCYGKQLVTFAEGEPLTLGRFPPELGEWGMQAAIYHAGLAFFELELVDADLGLPNDFSLCRRMMRAGVRFGMVDEIVVDKFESRRNSAEAWKHGDVPRVD